MALVIELKSGSWFRLASNKFLEVTDLPHIKSSIRFLDARQRILEVQVGSIKLGRNRENNILLDDIMVSGVHCEIIKHTFGHWAIGDLSSVNGTHIRRKGGVARVELGHFPIEKGDELLFANGAIVLLIMEAS